MMLNLTNKQVEFLSELAKEFNVDNPATEGMTIHQDVILDSRVLNGLWKKGLIVTFDKTSCEITEQGADYINILNGANVTSQQPVINFQVLNTGEKVFEFDIIKLEASIRERQQGLANNTYQDVSWEEAITDYFIFLNISFKDHINEVIKGLTSLNHDDLTHDNGNNEDSWL